MPATFTFTVSNVSPTAIIVQSACRRVLLRQKGVADGSSTQAWTVFIPASTSPALLKAVGESHEFVARAGTGGGDPGELFAPGRTLGFAQTASAPEIFEQQED